jgi:hypothetical protein
MFPRIPRAPAIAAIRILLQNDTTLSQSTPLTVDHIITLLEAVLHLAHFQWQSEFYAQTSGCAMGDGTSSLLSNDFMGKFEEKALTTYSQLHDTKHSQTTPTTPSTILFWFCQVDVELGWHGGGGRGWRMDDWMMWSYELGRL